jgi:hypothetical protein
VVDAYLMDVARAEDAALARTQAATTAATSVAPGVEPPADEPPDMFKAVEGRWGTREAEIVAVDLLRADGTPAHVFQSGERVGIRLRVIAHQPLSDFVFGVGIFNADGVCCYGTNTAIEGATPDRLDGTADITFHVERLDLVEGAYKVDVAVHRQNGAPYDYHRLLHAFRVTSAVKDTGIFRPAHRWTFSGGVRLDGL